MRRTTSAAFSLLFLLCLAQVTQLPSATSYSFRVSSADSAGNVSQPQWESLVTSSPRSDAGETGHSDQMLSDYKLCQNFPNPFNGSTNIRYHLPQGRR